MRKGGRKATEMQNNPTFRSGGDGTLSRTLLANLPPPPPKPAKVEGGICKVNFKYIGESGVKNRERELILNREVQPENQ